MMLFKLVIKLNYQKKFYVVNMILTLQTKYHHKEKIVVDIKKIKKNNLSNKNIQSSSQIEKPI